RVDGEAREATVLHADQARAVGADPQRVVLVDEEREHVHVRQALAIRPSREFAVAITRDPASVRADPDAAVGAFGESLHERAAPFRTGRHALEAASRVAREAAIGADPEDAA